MNQIYNRASDALAAAYALAKATGQRVWRHKQKISMGVHGGSSHTRKMPIQHYRGLQHD
jgi:hypothetical protein